MNTNLYFYLRANHLGYYGLRQLGLKRVIYFYFKSKSLWFYLKLVSAFVMVLAIVLLSFLCLSNS